MLFNVAEASTRKYADVSIKQVVDTLGTERPSVEDTLKRRQGIQVKYVGQANKKPKYQKMQKPVINQDAFYVLPQRLLKVCMKELPVSNKQKEVIAVTSQSQPTEIHVGQDAHSDFSHHDTSVQKKSLLLLLSRRLYT